MNTDLKGCSTCQPGKEQYEMFTMCGKSYIQYDYRTKEGALFSCVSPSLEKCRDKRDKWIAKAHGL